jgi:lactoylglutathione lyase
VSDDAFPIISVRDIGATRDFYAQLGFEQQYQFPPEGEPEFVQMQRGTASIGIGGASDDRFAMWVYVDDVDLAVADLTEGGAELVEAPTDRPWGERVATVRDPAGNLVHVGSPTAAA